MDESAPIISSANDNVQTNKRFIDMLTNFYMVSEHKKKLDILKKDFNLDTFENIVGKAMKEYSDIKSLSRTEIVNKDSKNTLEKIEACLENRKVKYIYMHSTAMQLSKYFANEKIDAFLLMNYSIQECDNLIREQMRCLGALSMYSLSEEEMLEFTLILKSVINLMSKSLECPEWKTISDIMNNVFDPNSNVNHLKKILRSNLMDLEKATNEYLKRISLFKIEYEKIKKMHLKFVRMMGDNKDKYSGVMTFYGHILNDLDDAINFIILESEDMKMDYEKAQSIEKKLDDMYDHYEEMIVRCKKREELKDYSKNELIEMLASSAKITIECEAEALPPKLRNKTESPFKHKTRKFNKNTHKVEPTITITEEKKQRSDIRLNPIVKYKSSVWSDVYDIYVLLKHSKSDRNRYIKYANDINTMICTKTLETYTSVKKIIEMLNSAKLNFEWVQEEKVKTYLLKINEFYQACTKFEEKIISMRTTVISLQELSRNSTHTFLTKALEMQRELEKKENTRIQQCIHETKPQSSKNDEIKSPSDKQKQETDKSKKESITVQNKTFKEKVNIITREKTGDICIESISLNSQTK